MRRKETTLPRRCSVNRDNINKTSFSFGKTTNTSGTSPVQGRRRRYPE
jgi:hypothetical protein